MDDYSTEIDSSDSLIKNMLMNVCKAAKFCCICCECESTLWNLSSEFCIIINGEIHKKLLIDIVSYVFGDEWQEILSSEHICDVCTQKTLQSYVFIYNTKELSKILNEYIENLTSKVNDVNNQLTGVEYENSKVCIVLAKPKEIANYIKNLETKVNPERNEINKPDGTQKRDRKIDVDNFKRVIKLIKKSPKKNKYLTKYGKREIQCKICNETFKTQRLIQSHYKSHEMERCKICHYIMPEKSLLDHLNLKHKDSIHVCETCNHVSYSITLAKAHITKQHSNPQCVMCLKTFKETELFSHSCKFGCLDCQTVPCIHQKYLLSYREQVQNGDTKMKCSDCDYIYVSRKALIGHVNREHLDHHPFTCDYCSQQFYSKTSLKNHLKSYHDESVVCEFCDENFKNKASLEDHIEICQLIRRPFKCEHCVSTFDTQQELDGHKSTKHVILYPCDLCTKKFVSTLKLKEHHLKIHNGIQIKRKRTNMECTICDLKFDDRKEFNEHIKTHGPDARFPCKTCKSEFDDIKKLHAHIRKHAEDVIKCSFCNKLVTEAYMEQHIMYCEANRNDERNTCEICGKNFQTDSILKIHKQIHVDPVACPICGVLIKPIYLKRHVNSHTNVKKKKQIIKNMKSVKCQYCSHMVTRFGELESHINRFHLKIKPYECNICSKKFCGKERLKDHIQTHSSDNNCYCTVCGKRFANKVCLKMHSRLHTGLRPYPCDICGETFRSSSIMKTHKVKKHTEKTVPCPLCDIMFYLAREMRSHFKKVHWKNKGKKFDPREMKELKEEYYHLFEDRRVPKLNDSDLVFS